MLRITGGAFKNKRLQSPPDSAVRPASDYMRQMVFNVLQHAAWAQDLAEYQVVDLFCGTGIYGLEAVSRGCSPAQFFDRDISLAAANVKKCGVETAKLQACALPRKLSFTGKPCLVFVDPPYGENLVERTMVQLALPAHSIVIVEAEAVLKLPALGGYRLLDNRRSGVSQLFFWLYEPAINQS